MDGPLSEYTGYTRPSNIPLDKPLPFKAIKGAAAGGSVKPGKEIGGTVYFTVLDRANGTPEDPWGTGAKDLEKIVKISRDVKSQKLDTEARFLFLYQVVNDSGLDASIHYTSIRLLVDPRLITSGGYVASRDKAGVTGAGFVVASFKDGKIVPAAAETMRAPGYRPVAPAYKASGRYLFKRLPLYRGVAMPAAWAEDKEIGREPDAVWLVDSDVFDDGTQGELNPSYRLPREVNDERRLVPDGPWETWNWVMDAKIRGINDTVIGPSPGELYRAFDRTKLLGPARPHFPMIRAYFHDNPIAPGERSTIFGFTCHYPPAFDYTHIAEKNPRGPAPPVTGPAGAPADGK
jgi:hypothetical protein